MKYNKIILIIALAFLVLPLVAAQEEPRFIASQSVELDLKSFCFTNGTFCTDTSLCNATILSPNTTIILNNHLSLLNTPICCQPINFHILFTIVTFASLPEKKSEVYLSTI